MNLQVLQGVYSNDIRLKSLAAALSLPAPKLRAYLDGLRGSSIAFVATAVWQLSDANHVFVLNDREEAAYFHNDLEHLTAALDIQYFPDSFKKTSAFNDLNASHIMLRTEALSKFSADGAKKKVLVAYPEALFEKVINPKSLKRNSISIKVGENLKVDELLERFVGLGFRREDFVYEPGQFAMRGGILDIYSFGNEHPYRIELFGNEVDSIRLFNPETQLSERKLVSVSILPNIETKAETGEKVSLLDYLPVNTCFWFKDFNYCFGKLGKLEDELPEKIIVGNIDEGHEETDRKELTHADFESAEAWKEKIRQRHVIEWFNHSLEKQLGDEVINVQFATEEQPVFNRQFDLLIKDLKGPLREELYALHICRAAQAIRAAEKHFRRPERRHKFCPRTHGDLEGLRRSRSQYRLLYRS